MSIPDRIGTHQIWREGDTIGIRWEGRITAGDMAALREVFRMVLLEHTSTYLVSNMGRCTSLEPGARKFMIEWSREAHEKVGGSAVFGVNFAMRALIMMAMKAIRLLGNEGSHAIEFVADEAAARRWISVRRLQVEAEARAAG